MRIGRVSKLRESCSTAFLPRSVVAALSLLYPAEKGRAVTADQTIDYDSIYGIMAPHAVGEQARIEKDLTRFVHYTTAQSALEILQSKCLWMRNATCMNDYNEMAHGLHCVIEAFRTDAGKEFNAALDASHAGLAKELDDKFTAAAPELIAHTYISSVSEHSDDEEAYGRLSMWQSYGSKAGAAIVLNPGPFLRPTDALPIWVSPVAYIGPQGVQAEIQKIAEKMDSQRALLATVPREELLEIAFRMLIISVVSSKHEGFREEREWRIVHMPTLWPADPERLPLNQVSLSGVPQPIFRIPFVDYPDEGFYGATIPDLIHRIIVGPTQYPAASRMAFAQVLGAAGVELSLDRVHCSDVTLRT